MEKVTVITSTAVPLRVENVDTDQIIPARFLKTISREGFGEKLFYDWRYDETKTPKSGFILNDSRYRGKILIAERNFGCGSSREHAVWALYDYGFRAVVSSFFADIFQNNALNNGLLPIQVSEKFLQEVFYFIEENPEQTLSIFLEDQTIFIDGRNLLEKFEINPYRKICLLNGFDSTDYLLNRKNEIQKYEQKSKYLKFINRSYAKEENWLIIG